MNEETDKRPTGLWIWLSEEGSRWRITRHSEGVWSCRIGIGGKRLGPWQAGLPPTLDTWPLGDFRE